jgi:hypothetical protein
VRNRSGNLADKASHSRCVGFLAEDNRQEVAYSLDNLPVKMYSRNRSIHSFYLQFRQAAQTTGCLKTRTGRMRV